MEQIVISGTGVFTPEESITNEELVKAYNEYAEKFNLSNKQDIDSGKTDALEPSNEEFIFNASGIKNRYCLLYTSPSPRDRTRSRMPSSA